MRILTSEIKNWDTKWKRPINSDYEKGRISIGEPCVLRTIPISVCVCLFLTGLLIMIIHHGIAFTHSSPANVGQKAGVVTSHAALRHICDRSNFCDHHQNDINLGKRIKNWQCQLVLELKSVIIKLRNVISKYDLKEEELKSLYPGVTDCGRDKCGKFSHLLPKNKKLEQFKCRKIGKPNALRKWTSRLLTFFQKGVGRFEKSFQQLISFEESPEFRKQYQSNRSRLRILKGFRTDLNTLNLEIIEMVNVTTHKRLTPQPSTTPLKQPESQTDLMINEWLIIQHSWEFLDKWRKQIEEVFKCWKKGIERGFKQKKQKSRKTVAALKEDEENFISTDRQTNGNYINDRQILYKKIYMEEMKRREKYKSHTRQHSLKL